MTKLREHADHTSHGSKCNVGEATLLIRPKKVCSDKRKNHYSGHLTFHPTGDKT